jgi:hypothetical protein
MLKLIKEIIKFNRRYIMKKLLLLTTLIVLCGLAFSLTGSKLPMPAAQTAKDRPVATNLFFSEYIEGSSNNKALEIFNGTGVPVDLTQYSVKLGSNGAQWGTSLTLTGTLANNDVFIIANAGAIQAILDLADVTSTVTYYNGDDALGLFQGTTLIDMIGLVGTDPGLAWPVAGVTDAMLNHTLIRKPTVASPTTDWAASAGTTTDDSQWIVQPIDYITDLGMHTFTPPGGNTVVAPTFTPPAGLYTTPINVTLATTTPNATIYYTLDGNTPTTSSTVYSTPIPIFTTTTIKAIATADTMDNSSVATALYSYPTTVTSLALLRTLPADNTSIYIVSGEVIITYKQTFRNQKWLQDSTAGVMIDDLGGIVTTVYNVGDGITGLTGKMTEFGGMIEFVPTVNPGPPSSTGNVITPEVITLSQLNANFENYESELVKVMNCTFVGAAGSFATGTPYPINDGTADLNFRTTFFESDYIGQAVPTTPMDLVGIPNSRTDGNYFTSRYASDIQTPQGNVAAPTFNPAPGIYYDPIQVALSSTTTGAVIHYTVNGDIPTAASPIFSAPINISVTTTVKAIAILGAESSAVSSATFTFTVPILCANLAALRAQATGTTVYRLTGEVVLTFQQANRHQKFVQDSSAGVLIDDFNGVVTTTYNVGDGITGLIGTLTEFGGMLEFVPVINPQAASSTGNTITPQAISIDEFNVNFDAYESELIKLWPVLFNTTETTFANGIVYPLAYLSDTLNFRSNFYDVDYIGTTIPTGAITLIGIANSRTDGNFITSRSLADIINGVFMPPDMFPAQIQNLNDVYLSWAPGPIPLAEGNTRDWENLTALKLYRNNALLTTITDFVIYEAATYLDVDLPNGEYTYYATNVYFNQYESDPSNPVTVNITANPEEPLIPATATALNGNFPNPFNPETTIRYSVKDKTPVTLSIYNLKGELVRTLVSETKGNGFYNTVWNGQDDSGKPVSSGVYLYRLQAGNFVSTQRMMLIQ